MNKKQWITEGFSGFRKGTFGNGGQNLYVSRKGVLQRIHQTDINRNGYLDLVSKINKSLLFGTAAMQRLPILTITDILI